MAKQTMDAAWSYRAAYVYMTSDCKMTRESLKDSLDARVESLNAAAKKAEEGRITAQAAAQSARDQAVAALTDPTAVANLLQDPQIQATVLNVLAQMQQQNAKGQQNGNGHQDAAMG